MGALLMSGKEQDRLAVLSRVRQKELTVSAAALELGLSLRQMRRVWQRFKTHGPSGLVHRLRGRPGNGSIDPAIRAAILKRHQDRYRDFGPTLACEKLSAERAEWSISPDTLTRLLKAQGLWERRRRRGKHRHRRERRACFGELVQMDGSHHDWFEGRRSPCVLMVMVDDATGVTWARLYESENLAAAFDGFGRWCQTHGIPRAVYVDRHGIYRDEEHPEKPTQFGRAMKELEVELILARSPQAKGRVERRNGLFQDRLVKELRLRKISDIQQANTLLEGVWMKDLNRRYAVSAASKTDLHRRAHPPSDLGRVLCPTHRRVVSRDWCVRHRNRLLQIAAKHAGLMLAGKTVRVKELAGGQVALEYHGHDLSHAPAARPPEPRSKPAAVNNHPWKPAKRHPWRASAVLRRTG
jgi:hypothetical protein